MYSLKPFNSVRSLLQAFPDEESCIKHLEYIRWNEVIISPFDSNSTVYKCSGNKYRCKNTKKYFNVRTETIFEGTKIPLQDWFVAIFLFTVHKKGISSYQLAEELNITQKTSWFMLQRIRYAMEHDVFIREMTGVIEVDETFVGGKNKNRHIDKKVKSGQGRAFIDKTPVIGMLNRDGKLKAVVVPDTGSSSLHPVLLRTIQPGSIVVTDEWNGYNGIGRHFNHQIVEHRRKQYQNDAGFSTNAIENFWSHLKRGLTGIYHQVSRRHLQGYVNEFVFRFNSRTQLVNERFDLFLGTVNGKRLTYRQLIRK